MHARTHQHIHRFNGHFFQEKSGLDHVDFGILVQNFTDGMPFLAPTSRTTLDLSVLYPRFTRMYVNGSLTIISYL